MTVALRSCCVVLSGPGKEETVARREWCDSQTRDAAGREWGEWGSEVWGKSDRVFLRQSQTKF